MDLAFGHQASLETIADGFAGTSEYKFRLQEKLFLKLSIPFMFLCLIAMQKRMD